MSIGSGNPNVWIIKTDSNGDTLWTKVYGGLSGDYARCVQQTLDGGYIIAGYTHSFASSVYEDMWLIRLGSENFNRILHTDDYILNQNYPNPFNPITTISFDLPKSSKVQLTIYNSNGEKVGTLLNSKLSRGNHKFNWNAINYPSGVYYYRIKTDGFINYKKCILIK